MTFPDTIVSYLNAVGFRWRRWVRVGRPLAPTAPTPEIDRRWQGEVGEFLRGFAWATHLPKDRRSLVAADIGARNFALAPTFHQLFVECGVAKNEIHGIEIDAYRRLADFRTRADYGKYFAAQIPSGFFHAIDFLEWRRALDVAFLLHPFVTPRPLLAWGLPLRLLQPQALFAHAHALLRERRGLLVVSSPSEAEFDRAILLAREGGFRIVERRTWHPGPQSLQRRPRLGAIAKVC